jgi:hypothetical protein
LVVAAQWLSVGRSLLRTQFKTAVWTLAGFILLTSPITLFVLTENQGQLNWVAPPTFLSLLEFAKLFTGYGGSALLALYLALCLVAWLATHQERKAESGTLDERQRVNFVLAWLVFPIASTVLISFLYPIFYDRYMSISAPALVLLAGKGLVDLGRVFPRMRSLSTASLVLVTGLSLWGIHRYDASPSTKGDNWQAVTQYILRHQQPGDAAFFYRASGSRPFTYYAHHEIGKQTAISSPTVIFPANLTDAQNFNVEPTKEQASRALGGSKRVWLILQHYQGLSERRSAKQAIEQALQVDYHLSQEESFSGGDAGPIEVYLYVREPA